MHTLQLCKEDKKLGSHIDNCSLDLGWQPKCWVVKIYIKKGWYGFTVKLDKNDDLNNKGIGMYYFSISIPPQISTQDGL